MISLKETKMEIEQKLVDKEAYNRLLLLAWNNPFWCFVNRHTKPQINVS